MAVRLIIIFASLLVCMATGSDVVIGILGSSVSIECSLPLSETLVWEDSSGDILAMNGIVSDSVSRKYVVEKQNGIREILVIHNLTLDDDKQYRCYDLKNATAVEVSKLNILVKPPVMKVSYPKEPVLEGTEVTLVCEANGGKPLPEITWYKTDTSGVTTKVDGNVDDVMYVNNTGHRRHSLLFNVTRETYMTSYACNISVSVFYQRSLKVNLTVHLMPQKPSVSGYESGFDVGKELKLECMSTGSTPTALIYWMINNQRIGDYEFVVIPQGNGTSTVKSFFKRTMSRDFNDSVLTCAVTNDVLEKRGLPPKMTNLTLLASYKPIISVGVSNHTLVEGANVTIQCHVDALPDPLLDSLVWLHNGQVIYRELYVMQNETDVFGLQLINITRAEAGEYHCRASNRLGESSSGPISVTILYAPVCKSTDVVKIAARFGSSVRLHCHMEALPNNVTLLWRYKESHDMIKTTPARTDNSNGEYAYGSLDLDIRSYSQYTKIGCYGSSAVGQGQVPCEYQIVRPSAPDTPQNCSVTTTNSNISIACVAGFSGGSMQHFMLQQQTMTGYQTLKNNSLPVFAFSSDHNLTARVCSVNTEFSHTASCAYDVTVAIQLADFPLPEPVVAKDTSTTAYIAGGVTAFVGVLIIITIVIVLIRRKQKQRHGLELSNTLQDVVRRSDNKQENNSKTSRFVTALWKSVKSIGKPREKTCASTARVRQHEVVTTIVDDDNDATYQNIEVTASTPYSTVKQYRVNKDITKTDIAILRAASAGYQQHRRSNGQLDVLNASTGFVLSPISVHSESSGMSRLSDVISKSETRIDQTETVIGEGYHTADIADVLDETERPVQPMRLEYTTDVDDTLDDCLVTQNKEYSAGDILEALVNTELTENDNQKDVSSNDSKSYIFESWLNDSTIKSQSHDKDDSDVSKINLYVSKLCVSGTYNTDAFETTNTHLSNGISLGEERNTFNRVSSLPFRPKTKTKIVRINSVPDIRTLSGTDIIKQPSLTGGFYGKSDTSGYWKDESHELNERPDTVSFSKPRDKELNVISTTPTSSSCSLVTAAGDTLCDIDEYTLTITSETNTDCCSGPTETVNEFDNELGKLETNLDDVEQTDRENLGYVDSDSEITLDRTSFRRSSFLSAVSNDMYHSRSLRSTNNLFIPDSDTEQSYFNAGFEHEENIDVSSLGKNRNQSEDTKRISGVDIVAYF